MSGYGRNSNCENCWYWDYDEELDDYYCMMDLDEDEFVRIFSAKRPACPYFRRAGEYDLPGKQ